MSTQASSGITSASLLVLLYIYYYFKLRATFRVRLAELDTHKFNLKYLIFQVIWPKFSAVSLTSSSSWNALSKLKLAGFIHHDAQRHENLFVGCFRHYSIIVFFHRAPQRHPGAIPPSHTNTSLARLASAWFKLYPRWWKQFSLLQLLVIVLELGARGTIAPLVCYPWTASEVSQNRFFFDSNCVAHLRNYGSLVAHFYE